MGPELQDVVDEVSRLLGAPATLEDRAFHLVAFGRQSESADDVRLRSILQRGSTASVRAFFEQFGIADAEGPVRTPADATRGIAARLCLPARSGGVVHGYLWLLEQDLGDVDGRLAQAMELASRAGRLLARNAREQRSREDRLTDLYGDDRASAERAADDLVDSGLLWAGEPFVVAAVRTTGGLDSDREPVRVRLGQLPGTILTVTLRGHTALLVPLRDGPTTARHAVRTLLTETAEPAGVVAGLGGCRRDLREAHRSWAEARLAARVAALVPEQAPLADWPSLGAYRLLGAAPEAVLAGAVLDDAVRALLDEPDERLAVTARRYLDLAGSAQATAAALQIHRQTLYYRLQRIEQVTGLDLRRGEDRLRLHLGLQLGPLLGAG